MKELVLSWEETGRQVIYLVNGNNAGLGDAGFDEVIRIIKENPEIRRIVLKTDKIGSGGQSLQQLFPFAHRYNELKEALGEKEIVIDFF